MSMLLTNISILDSPSTVLGIVATVVMGLGTAIKILWGHVTKQYNKVEMKLDIREKQLDELRLETINTKTELATVAGKLEGHVEARSDFSRLVDLSADTLDFMARIQKHKKRQQDRRSNKGTSNDGIH